MFTTVIAYAGFVVTTIIFVVLIADGILNYQANASNARKRKLWGQPPATYWNYKMLVICLVWVASGIYLWG